MIFYFFKKLLRYSLIINITYLCINYISLDKEVNIITLVLLTYTTPRIKNPPNMICLTKIDENLSNCINNKI